MSNRLPRLALVLVGALVLLTGCHVAATVNVHVLPNGTGFVSVQVQLDAAAAAKVGDLSKVVSIADLEKVGWKVTGPGPADRVHARLVAAGRAEAGGAKPSRHDVLIEMWRPFKNVEQANQILASINGPDGPFERLRLGRTSSFTSTKLTATGRVDLTHGLDAFGDASLSKSLKGESVSDLVKGLNGGKAPGPGDLSVAVRLLPNGTGLAHSSADGVPAGASTSLGAKPSSFAAAASQRHWTALLLAAVAVLAALAALVTVVLPRLTGRTPAVPDRKRQRHSRHDGWDYVERVGGPGRTSQGRAERGSGRHSRRKGEPPRWTADEIAVDPLEVVYPREHDGPDEVR